MTLIAVGCGPKSSDVELPEVALDMGTIVPDWFPAYSSDQEALLRPTDTPVVVPAARVFPDLSRFGYSNNRRLRDPRDSLKFTRLVASVLEESPRLYSMVEAGPELENRIAQYGPAGMEEADPWYVASFDDGGLGQLTPAPLTPEGKAAYAEGLRAQKAGDATAALEAFRGADAASPGVPGLAYAVAEALAASGSGEAEAAYERTIAIDPTFAPAHRGLAAWALAHGDQDRAREELTQALAYHPPSPAAMALARELAPTVEGSDHRPEPFRIFLDVDAVGAVRVGSTSDGPAQIYAGCRAVMRFEPELRAAVFDQPPSTPYYLSVAEEVLCIESAIGAYLFGLAEDAEAERESPLDARVEALLRMAQAEGLSGYVMFEILGRHRPERARTAPADVHQDMATYVARHVLGGAVDLPPGHVMASLR